MSNLLSDAQAGKKRVYTYSVEDDDECDQTGKVESKLSYKKKMQLSQHGI